MKAEIFGTFGPACGSEEILKNMIDAGMTGMRLNLSHTTLSDSAEYINCYKNVAKVCGVKPQILIDMKGPELRIGNLRGNILLEVNQKLFFCEKELCDDEMDGIYVPVPLEVLATIEERDQILLDDGKILVEVDSKPVDKREEQIVIAKVLRGGELSSGKSIKIIDKQVAMPPLTEHDINNIKVAKEYEVTALMQPFVLCGEDLRYVRSVLKEYDAEDVWIFAKIENRIGVENLEDILPEADVIIIARGDLGNDMPLWELPRVQKQIEEICKKHNKPYIVVTQMLASMEKNPVPTRAEVSDIYHAVYHGAWGVMLTGETAVGNYPVEAIRYLANTAKEAEKK